jgi:hypothetical protein
MKVFLDPDGNESYRSNFEILRVLQWFSSRWIKQRDGIKIERNI